MERLDYSCVYRHKRSDIVLRDATDETACDQAVPDSGAKGFRLPTSMEWELAARYINGGGWTPGNYASGAAGHTDNKTATGAVAWYHENSGNSTHPVGTKQPNSLGIYDMSGNVWEWCYDWHPEYIGSYRVFRGGSWNNNGIGLRVGGIDDDSPSSSGADLGFRIVRSL